MQVLISELHGRLSRLQAMEAEDWNGGCWQTSQEANQT